MADVGEKICWACGCDLVPRQKYCVECGHWQNWRRYTVFSATILSLLIALLTVVGSLAPQFVKLTHVKEMLVDLTGQVHFNGDGVLEISLLADNFGDYDVTFPEVFICRKKSLENERFLFHSFDGSVIRINRERLVRYRLQFVQSEDQYHQIETGMSEQSTRLVDEGGELGFFCEGDLYYGRFASEGRIMFPVYGNTVVDPVIYPLLE